MLSGKYFVLEGGDGSGKGTQLIRLEEKLRNLGRDFIITREPGGTRIGEDIREIILHNASADLEPLAELLLFSAGRRQLITELIRPAINMGRIVISDRCFLSTIAYQGYGRGLDLSIIKQLCAVAVDGTLPDKIYYLDINPEDGKRRMQGRSDNDNFDGEAIEFHQKVRDGYLLEADRCPDLIEVIDASRSIEKVHEDLLSRMMAEINN